MVLTKSQIKKLSREELIEELLKVYNISDNLRKLTDTFNTFATKYKQLKKALPLIKSSNSLPQQIFLQLEQNAVSNAQCHRRDSLEVNPVPRGIEENAL